MQTINIDRKDYVATIKFVDEKYRLWWTDGVVNEWTEHYDSLALALLRVAVLDRCVESDLSFGQATPDEFADVAKEFLLKASEPIPL